MSQEQLVHRETPSIDPHNEYVRQIRQMRTELDAVRTPDGKERGPLSHALNRDENFASPSQWTLECLLRFQVVVLDHQPDVSLFPKRYIVLDEDKTLVAATKDEFFVNKDFRDRGWSQKLHSNFFIDLMQLSSSKPIPATSTPIREPYASLAQSSNTRLMASKSLDAVQKGHSASYSLIHNFLKYVASMEHLAYPDLQFWCPW
jgi:hypothetical protein